MAKGDGGIGDDIPDETTGVANGAAGSDLPVDVLRLGTIQKDKRSVGRSYQCAGHLEDPLSS